MTESEPGPGQRVTLVIVVGLVVIAILGLCGIIYLIAIGAAGEDVTPLVALTGPAIGGVTAMLVSTNTKGQ